MKNDNITPKKALREIKKIDLNEDIEVKHIDVDKLFSSNKLNVSRYVHIDKIYDPDMLSRVLSIELLINDRF